MYEDADQDTTATGHGDEMTVTVDGEQYELETEFDINKDGTNDTAIVTTDDGGQVAFTDSDKDGDADVAVELDDKGNVVGAARYDEASGEWVPIDPKTGDATGEESSAAGEGTPAASATGDIIVDVPDDPEDMSAGAATVDMNKDGKNDTAVVQSENGDVYAFTDSDGDGEADQMTVIESDGSVSISQHTGEDEWAEVEKGHLDSQGNYVPDSQRS
ncbi:hypothetical protein LWC34_20435 [Kibdelosporangium philippinense]|uniref:DUF6802 domain-containing protein n=1 Tax=Kibdelosporangium philippinense TaxID=211113 RepID=A0ABS8ZBD0_9PSEU|nr:DUF6802 family protein [Kibdelosporangium philippinense]MCE7005176.1 hypothetical protein [Kibdelosporangium philippinense]